MSTDNAVLVVGAHPDDETFGCGGTLARLRKEGRAVHWVIVTESWEPKWTAAYREKAAAQVDAIAAHLRMASVRRLRLPAARLDAIALTEIVDPLSQIIGDIKPVEVLTVGPHDVNTDHQLVFRAVSVAVKPSYASSVRRIMSYEMAGSTDWALAGESGQFRPTVFVDVSAFIEEKLELARLYSTELREPPHPRSLEGVRALARTRGLSVGTEYAEAFELHRELIR